jgi:hypothetical protein
VLLTADRCECELSRYSLLEWGNDRVGLYCEFPIKCRLACSCVYLLIAVQNLVNIAFYFCLRVFVEIWKRFNSINIRTASKET